MQPRDREQVAVGKIANNENMCRHQRCIVGFQNGEQDAQNAYPTFSYAPGGAGNFALSKNDRLSVETGVLGAADVFASHTVFDFPLP
jgi:hypothetical protein